MMINQNIIKFFGYEKKELLGTLIISAIFVFRNHDKNNRLLDKILIASKIDLEAPLFLKELEEQLNLLKNNKEENEILFASILKHSPSILQNSTITWTYYAIYFAFNLKDGNIFISKDEKVLSEILNLPLELHYNYLKYKELEEKEGLQKNERQQEYFFKDITIGVVRTLEYLAKFYLSKNEHLFNTYLYNIEDHYKNLVELANNDIIESSCFFIVHDPISNNFLKYENAEFGIHYQVLSSRKITTGASTGEEFNSKITNYLKVAFEKYQKLINYELKKQTGFKRGNSAKKNILQATEEEEFIKENDIKGLDFKNKEQINEQNQRVTKRARSSLIHLDETLNEPNYIANKFGQHKRNISFSASITKSKLLLSTDYRIPELNHLKDFLKYLSSNKNTNFSEINTYSKGVFILSLVFGFTVEDLILFLHNEHQSIKQLKKGKISSAIDPELFSKYKVNTLLKKTGFTINYVLQDDLYKLMNKLTKYMPEYSNLYYYLKNIKWETSCKVHLLEISNQNIRLIVNLKILERFSSFKEDYFKSMGKIINEYDKKIIIDLNNIWKITLRLSKVFFGDDTIAMLSIAKYQRNDTAKLSYSSTQNFSQKHSLFVEKISTSLDLPNVISKLLNIKYEPSSHSFSTIESNYVGSHRALNHNISRDFFGKMYDLIIQEENKYKKFNLISIYIRYAMSILCGTRDSKNSSSIENISFLMHTQMITEKSDSKLSGIRIIPLCIKIENLIKYYNETSEKLNIKLNYISLYDNNNFIKFNKKSAFKIIENISSDKKLQNFINFIPVNVGRHIITQYKIEKKFNATYIATFLGHYGSGEEQLGIYSPLNLPQYIHYIRENMENIANLYGIKEL